MPTSELTVDNTPSPASILEEAKKAENRKRYRLASDYIKAIIVLRKKDYTWREIQEWFASQDLPFSQGALQSAHQKHHGGTTYVKY